MRVESRPAATVRWRAGTVQIGAISLLAGCGFLALIIFRRRRRIRRALSRGLPCLLLVLAVSPARAQNITLESDEMSGDQSKAFRTSKEWAIELRFGAYRPDVDSEVSGSGQTPYKTMFGGGRHLMSQLEVDWQFFQKFGSLAAAVATGYYSVGAKAFVADPATGKCVTDPSAPGVCVRSGDSTSLRLIPVAALLVYRWTWRPISGRSPWCPTPSLGSTTLSGTSPTAMEACPTRRVAVVRAAPLAGKPVPGYPSCSTCWIRRHAQPGHGDRH